MEEDLADAVARAMRPSRHPVAAGATARHHRQIRQQRHQRRHSERKARKELVRLVRSPETTHRKLAAAGIRVLLAGLVRPTAVASVAAAVSIRT